MGDQLAKHEAKFGKEVDAAMGPEPDVGRYARRYESLSKRLPVPGDLQSIAVQAFAGLYCTVKSAVMPFMACGVCSASSSSPTKHSIT